MILSENTRMKSLLIFLTTILLPSALSAGETSTSPAPASLGTRGCRLIIDAHTGKTLVRQGPCDVRQTPCSSFKLPLALIGFDSGILKGEHEPAWDFPPDATGLRPEEKQKIDPTTWESISVLWYSQKLVARLGAGPFQKYVDRFDYGNRDLTGDKGKDNGLTRSWVMSSLLVSPDEQVRFLKKLHDRQLGVSPQAYGLTEKILPRFPAADGWILTGKTGSGFQLAPDGTTRNRKLHIGWFIGWAEKGERKLLFAQLLVDDPDKPNDNYGGLRSREILINDFAAQVSKAEPRQDND